jgi:hypothetical protein
LWGAWRATDCLAENAQSMTIAYHLNAILQYNTPLLRGEPGEQRAVLWIRNDFFGSDPGSGSDFSESSGSDPGSGSFTVFKNNLDINFTFLGIVSPYC